MKLPLVILLVSDVDIVCDVESEYEVLTLPKLDEDSKLERDEVDLLMLSPIVCIG